MMMFIPSKGPCCVKYSVRIFAVTSSNRAARYEESVCKQWLVVAFSQLRRCHSTSIVVKAVQSKTKRAKKQEVDGTTLEQV